METFNDLDFIFLLIDVLVVVAGICAVVAWWNRQKTIVAE